MWAVGSNWARLCRERGLSGIGRGSCDLNKASTGSELMVQLGTDVGCWMVLCVSFDPPSLWLTRN